MNKCVICKKELTGRQIKYCSSTCKNIYMRHNPVPSKLAKRSKKPRLTNCEVCGRKLTGIQRRFCSIGCKNQLHQSYPQQKRRALYRKVVLVQKLGGACKKCGYNKNLAALSFHHLGDKEHKLDMRSLSNRRLEVVMNEFEKCELLCANCHMETHWPEYDVENLNIDGILAREK